MPEASAVLPRVEVFALGGTIASLPGGPGAGVSPSVSVDDLLAAVPALASVARVAATQFLQVPSCEVTPGDLLRLLDELRAAVDAGADGCVVTQGTDTLEETAFLLDLLWDRSAPVVVTGAMRTPDAPGADGPANLLAAVRVAADPAARECGVLAVLGDEIHSGRHVRKAHTAHPSAFTSPGTGAIGWLSEGHVRVVARPTHRRPALLVPSGGPAQPLPHVVVVRVGMGEQPDLLRAVAALGVDGVVLEGVGGGHVPRTLVPALVELVERVPVVLTSRAGAGDVLSTSYGYPGGDVDLVARGLVPAGTADAAKARLALILALAVAPDREGAEEFVRRI